MNTGISEQGMKQEAFRLLTKAALIVVVISVVAVISDRVKSLKEENARLKSNQEALLAQAKQSEARSQFYTVSDSLSAAKAPELQLTLAEYKKYRAEEAALIKRLDTRGKDLQKAISLQAETMSRISAELRDSVRTDTAAAKSDTVKCFNYKSVWTDASGCVDLRHGSVELQVLNRESIKVVETVERKRFLGFLWKTKKIKSRQIDAVSENPNTIITNLGFVSVVK